MENNVSIKKMFLISLIAGFLSTMNVFVDKWNDIRFHLNDVYMILLMSGWMTLFMILVNHDMFKYNSILIFILIILITLILYFIRNQIFVSDIQYLNSMIPHHSMAILMSKKIKEKTKNKKIQQLANQIIDSQTKEIQLINDILKEYK